MQWKILRRWAKGRGHQGRQKEEEQARWAGPGGRGVSPPIQVRITPLAEISPTYPEGSPHRPLPSPKPREATL